MDNFTFKYINHRTYTRDNYSIVTDARILLRPVFKPIEVSISLNNRDYVNHPNEFVGRILEECSMSAQASFQSELLKEQLSLEYLRRSIMENSSRNLNMFDNIEHSRQLLHYLDTFMGANRLLLGTSKPTILEVPKYAKELSQELSQRNRGYTGL